MAGRQAKVISRACLARMLAHADRTSDPLRNRLIVLLSVKAGLRACEIARLEWPMVIGATGRVGSSLVVEDRIAKGRRGRRLPLHPQLRAALQRLHRAQGGPRQGPIIASRRGGAMRPNSIVNWFVALFEALRFNGCSSHSGRRTFITVAARNVHRVGGSLRDVQLLAGHSSLVTTQRYIDGDAATQHRLVALI